MSELRLFRSREHACGYLDDHTAQEVVVDPDIQLNPGVYSALLSGGFRRSGGLVYRPECGQCQACQPARIPTAAFAERRRHRRCLKRNADVAVDLTAVKLRDEHQDLYQRYLAARHPDSPMGEDDGDTMQQFMGSDWCQTVLMNYRLNDRLIGFAITDLVPSGLSAMYTVFDPDERNRGLGTWSILQQINLARRYGLRWLYLGYWIQQCQSMAYKASFSPLEIRDGDTWRPLEPTAPIPSQA